MFIDLRFQVLFETVIDHPFRRVRRGILLKHLFIEIMGANDALFDLVRRAVVLAGCQESRAQQGFAGDFRLFRVAGDLRVLINRFGRVVVASLRASVNCGSYFGSGLSARTGPAGRQRARADRQNSAAMRCRSFKNVTSKCRRARDGNARD